ncbi:MAG: nucleotidyltransferase [Bdellovibrio sp.]|nr:MAG: nucleotidyltransferase [Bdellovibrio sp.]
MKLTLQDVVRVVKDNETEIRKFGVQEVYIFGSVARGDSTSSSDVDIFVEFGPSGCDFFTLYDLEKFLEQKLQTRVDVGTKRALHPLLKDKIMREAVRVA